jgi:HEPN domain-containing protein
LKVTDVEKAELNLSRAKAYLEDANHERDRADNLTKSRDWNGAVEASQHSIENSIKSLFLLVGEEHPFEHDPTAKFDLVMEKLHGLRQYNQYYWERLARIRWIAKVWATIHEESMYPFYDIPARKFFEEKDAKVLKDYADEVYRVCSQLVSMFECKEIKA